MDRSALAEVFKQIIEGYDIPTPAGMLRVKREDVAILVEPLPYSLLTNLAHANLWQRLWLASLKGGSRKAGMEEWKNDFRIPDPSEWNALRKEFLEGLLEAQRIAASEPFDHKLQSDQEAVEKLVKIAVHGAYHCGQMNLLKRAIKNRT